MQTTHLLVTEQKPRLSNAETGIDLNNPHNEGLDSSSQPTAETVCGGAMAFDFTGDAWTFSTDEMQEWNQSKAVSKPWLNTEGGGGGG